MTRVYGGEFGDTLEQLKARVPFTQDMQGLGFDGCARKVGAVLLLAGVSGELIEHIEQLTAELESVKAMAAMLNDREWAEHAGKGEAAQAIEAGITQLHGELGTERDLFRFLSYIGYDEELCEELDKVAEQVMGKACPAEAENPDELRDLVEKLYAHATQNGMWPREVPA